MAQRCHVDPAAFGQHTLDIFDAIVYSQERTTLENAVRTELNDEPFEPSQAHLELSRLPWRAVVTTNYDGLLSRVLGQEPVVREDDYQRLSPPSIGSMLIQLHGDLKDPHTLTREDYREWAEYHPQAFHRLKDLLLNGTVLFVGYSLSDPHIDNLLANVRRITSDHNKRLFGWFWKLAPEKAVLLDRRDRITADSLETEQDWAYAFQQLGDAVREASQLKDLRPLPLLPPADSLYDRVQYVKALQAYYGFTNLSAIYVWGPGYARSDVTLKEVFVQPDLVPLDKDRGFDTAKDATQTDAPVTDASLIKSPLSRALEMVEQRNQDSSHREPAASWLAREARLLIVAAPGQGKSTLLRVHLLHAVQLWEEDPQNHPLPIYVRLSDWEARSEPAESQLLAHVRQILPRLGEISSRQLEHWLQTPLLWLLDGLDEIRDRHERVRLHEEVSAAVRLRPADRWVITTRPSGRPGAGFAEWTWCSMPPLTDPQVQQVLENWRAILVSKEQIELPVSQMWNGLRWDAGLRRLRGNALLLTLAVLFYKSRRRLPQDRWEFYDVAEQVLRDAWVQHRLRRSHEHLPGNYLSELLERLALAGMIESEVLFSRNRLESEARELMAARGFSAGEQNREVAVLLAAAEDLIGIIVAQGPERFGFLHLTFQEYFAARALRQRSGEAGKFIARYWDHPDWIEVWDLYSLAIQGDTGRWQELFQTIMANGHELDEFLERPRLTCLRLAGAGNSPLPAAAESVLAWVETSITPSSAHIARECAFILAGFERPLPPSIRDRLISLLKPSKGAEAEMLIYALSQASSETVVRDVLLARLGHEESGVRWAAAEALSTLVTDLEVRNHLFKRLKDPAWEVRAGATVALTLADFEAEIEEALLEQLNDPYAAVRSEAAIGLASGLPEDRIRDALLERLEDRAAQVRTAAIFALEDSEDQSVKDALLAKFHDKSPSVRLAACEAFGRADFSAEALDAMLKCLEDRSYGVRDAAQRRLALWAANETARRRIIDLLYQGIPAVRAMSARALGGVAVEPEVRHTLLAMLGDKAPEVRAAAVAALANHSAEPEVHNALLPLLSDRSLEARAAAARGLGKTVLKPATRCLLVARLNDPASIVRAAAASALTKAVGDSDVGFALLPLLEDQHDDVRAAATEALREVGSKPPFQAAMMLRLHDENRKVRLSAVAALEQSGNEPAVQQALIAQVSREDALVGRMAADILERTILKARHNFGK